MISLEFRERKCGSPWIQMKASAPGASCAPGTGADSPWRGLCLWMALPASAPPRTPTTTQRTRRTSQRKGMSGTSSPTSWPSFRGCVPCALSSCVSPSLLHTGPAADPVLRPRYATRFPTALLLAPAARTQRPPALSMGTSSASWAMEMKVDQAASIILGSSASSFSQSHSHPF